MIRISILASLLSALIFTSVNHLAYADCYDDHACDYKDYDPNAHPDCPPCPCLPSLKDGFYIGGAVGYDSYRLRNKVNFNIGLTVDAFSVNNATGGVGGVFAGFGKYIYDYFYLGAEIFGNLGSADTRVRYTTNFTANYFLKFRTRYSYGMSLLPGIKIMDTTLGYFRLGFNWVNFRTNETASFFDFHSDLGQRHTRNGFNFGLGFETLVYDHFSLRGEYTHTAYNSFHSSPVVTLNHPTDNQVMLGLVYHIC